VIEALLSVTLLLVSETHVYIRPETAYAAEPPVKQAVEAPELPEDAIIPTDALDTALDTQVRCNCVLRVRQHHPSFPRIADLTYNSPNAQEGAVIILQYKTLKHYAYIEKILQNGYWVDECNYKRCQCGKRFIEKHDPRIVGFWNPEADLSSVADRPQ
jgi:hypothetical protein